MSSSTRPTRHTQRALAVVEHAPLRRIGSQPSQLAKFLEQGGPPTKRQKKIAVETVTRAGTIQAQDLLHEWASEHIHRAHVTSQTNVFQTLSRLNATLSLPMDEQTAKDLLAWTTAQKQLLIRHESTLLDGVVTNMTRTATKPLPDDDEEPKGVLAWLLGR